VSKGHGREQKLVWCRLAALVVSALSLTRAHAQPAMKPEDAIGARAFADLLPAALSPDCKWLAYTVREGTKLSSGTVETWATTGIRDAHTGTDIWITNTRTGEAKNLTGGQGSNFSPVWSPDGKYLAFFSDRDGSGQARLWLWDAERSEIRKLSEISVRYLPQIEWTPDGRHLLVPTLPRGVSISEYAERVSSRRKSWYSKASEPHILLYRYPPSSEDTDEQESGAWNLSIASRDLSLVDVQTGHSAVVVPDQRIQSFHISPDGSEVAYAVLTRFENPASQQELFDLRIASLGNGRERTVAHDIRLGFNGYFAWSMDGSRLAYRAYGPEERHFDIYVVARHESNAKRVTQFDVSQNLASHTSERVIWNASGDALYFVTEGLLWRGTLPEDKAAKISEIPGHEIVHLIADRQGALWTVDGQKSTVVVARDREGEQDAFYKVDLSTGHSEKLLERNQCYTCNNVFDEQLTAVSADGQHLVYWAEDSQHDSDLWMSDDTFRDATRLTRLNPQFDPSAMGTARLIEWLSSDGGRMKGALLVPAQYYGQGRCPLVVAVYGGARLSRHWTHFGGWARGVLNAQLLATRGFAVLLPDAPQNLGTPMSDLAKTVLPGVNKAIELGIADPNRLAIIGHSYGGYSVLALLAQTNRFKAAVEMDGLADLVAGYGAMDMDGSAYLSSVEESGQVLMGGNPWQVRDRYIENSPIFHLDQVQTPLLIVHGGKDTSVPPFLGDEIFVAMRRLKREVQYAKYLDEGHSPLFWSYADQLDLWNRVDGWLREHLH
jgi:dipeptidyl aminopeptidase/acylaminoacyl peptidase